MGQDAQEKTQVPTEVDPSTLLAKRIAAELWKSVWIFAGSLLAILFLKEILNLGKDATDPESGRSGMRLLIDAETGVEYLSTPGGGIILRRKKDEG